MFLSRPALARRLLQTRPLGYTTTVNCALRARGMASSSTGTGKKIEWLVMLPDNEGVLDKRMEVRPAHLDAVKPNHEKNFWIMGGAFFSSVPVEGETPPIIGSCMVAYAETKEEVLESIMSDIYTKSGVWDTSKIQIWPFRSAIRSGIETTQPK